MFCLIIFDFQYSSYTDRQGGFSPGVTEVHTSSRFSLAEFSRWIYFPYIVLSQKKRWRFFLGIHTKFSLQLPSNFPQLTTEWGGVTFFLGKYSKFSQNQVHISFIQEYLLYFPNDIFMISRVSLIYFKLKSLMQYCSNKFSLISSKMNKFSNPPRYCKRELLSPLK